MKLAKELFNQMKSVLVVKSATYTHSMEVKTSDFIVKTLPTVSGNISLNRSNLDSKFEKSFELFEVYIIFLFDRIFLLIFMVIFLDISPRKWLTHNNKDRGCHLHK